MFYSPPFSLGADGSRALHFTWVERAAFLLGGFLHSLGMNHLIWEFFSTAFWFPVLPWFGWYFEFWMLTFQTHAVCWSPSHEFLIQFPLLSLVSQSAIQAVENFTGLAAGDLLKRQWVLLQRAQLQQISLNSHMKIHFGLCANEQRKALARELSRCSPWYFSKAKMHNPLMFSLLEAYWSSLFKLDLPKHTACVHQIAE